MSRILITGIAGFVGSHVADRLQADGHAVFGIDNLSTGKGRNLHSFMDKGGRYVLLDIQTVQASAEIREFSPDAIVHLAAQAAISTSWENSRLDMQVNGLGTINVLEAALKYGVKRFIFSSTSAVYDDKFRNASPIREYDPLQPSSPYGISKLAAEGYVRAMLPSSVILRFGNVYGPRQVSIGGNQVVPLMLRHLEYDDDFCIHGSGNQQRDFVYVDDIVDAIIKSIDGEPGTYNVGTGSSVSINRIGFILRDRYDLRGFSWNHTDREDPRPFVCLDNSLAKTGLGWEPKVDIVDGLNRTVDWWKAEKVNG